MVFPHEEDYLLIDSAGRALTTALVRRRLLVSLEQGVVTSAPAKTDPWLVLLENSLESITKRYPLPRTMFLVAPDSVREALKGKLENAPVGSLRLSSESATVIPLAPAHLTDHLKLGLVPETDLELELLAIFAGIPRG